MCAKANAMQEMSSDACSSADPGGWVTGLVDGDSDAATSTAADGGGGEDRGDAGAFLDVAW